MNVQSGGPFEDVYGYCRAVRVGNAVHVAGTCARLDELHDHSTYAQSASALDIIARALSDVGASPADVVRTVTYVTDIDDALDVARAHKAMFDGVRPAATLVEVSALADPAFTVEIEAYAVIDDTD
ncbi:MAG: RidA family protein [Acidimicrobiia bacterium]|nr:RidA family protein [Acidimicrobiia bacterium]